MDTGTKGPFSQFAEALLNTNRPLMFRARGRSMQPFIRDGETVVVAPCTRKLHLGDVVLVKEDSGQLLLHRIVGISPDGVVVRGDALLQKDGQIGHQRVLGRAVRVVGGLSFHLRFPMGALMLLLLHLRKWPKVFSALRKTARLFPWIHRTQDGSGGHSGNLG